MSLLSSDPVNCEIIALSLGFAARDFEGKTSNALSVSQEEWELAYLGVTVCPGAPGSDLAEGAFPVGAFPVVDWEVVAAEPAAVGVELVVVVGVPCS